MNGIPNAGCPYQAEDGYNDRNRFPPGHMFIGEIENGKRYPLMAYTKTESDARYAPIGTATDIAALTEEVAGKADAVEVTAALAEKADAADVAEALASKADVADLAEKADAADVEAALAAKADASDVETALATKADADTVEAALAEKADSADVTEALAGKANASDVAASIAQVNTALSGKASTTAVNAALAGKADKAETAAALEAKADAASVAADLAEKADAADLATTNAAVATKADSSAVAAALEEKADAADVAEALTSKADKTTTDSLQAQINEAIAAVTQDAEVQNARVGADGETYETLKERLDTENEGILSKIDGVEEVIPKVNQAITAGRFNILDYTSDKHGIFLNSVTGEEEEREQYNSSDFIKVTSGGQYTIKTFQYTGSAIYRIYYYDISKAYISRTTSNVADSPTGLRFSVPSGCNYVRLVFESAANESATQDESSCVLMPGSKSIVEYVQYYTASDAVARERVQAINDAIASGDFSQNLMGKEVGKFYRVDIKQGEQLTITKSDGSIFPSDNDEKIHFYDSSKRYVAAASLNTGLTYKTVAAMPSDITYARWMPGFGTYSTPMMVVKGTEPKEYVEYYDNPRQLREDMSATDADIYSKMSRADALNNKIPGYMFPDVDHWEIGGINISASGWEYGANSNRIRTKEDYTIPVRRGDIISLSDYTDARFNVGVLRSDGSYGFTGWRSADYISTVDGEIVMVVGNLTDKPQDSVYDLMNLISIKRNMLHKSPTGHPILTIIDDDTLSIEHVQKFYSACVEKGVVGTFASEMHYVESETGLKELLQTYENAGFEVAFHCNQQTEIYRSDQQYRDSEAMESDFTRGLRKYREWFLPCCAWVTPYGSHDAEIQALAKKRGFDAIVSIAQNTYERVGIYSGRYFIPRIGLNQTDGEGSVTLAQLKSIMADCASEKGWLLIGTHFNEWSDIVGFSRFYEIIDLAVELGFQIKTLGEAYRIWKPFYDERDRDAMNY